MIIHALQEKPLPLYGDGEYTRDWLYVEDHCAAIDLVIHRGVDGEVYNIGGNNEKTNLEVAESILTLLDKPRDLIRFVPDRPGHDRRYAIDSNSTMVCDQSRLVEWEIRMIKGSNVATPKRFMCVIVDDSVRRVRHSAFCL